MKEGMEDGMEIEIVEDVKTETVTENTDTNTLPANEERKDIAPLSEMGRLMQYALDKDKVEALEKLYKIKREEDAIQCKKEFDYHFSLMQAEFKPVKRDTDGNKTKAGSVAFKYAPIEKYIETNGFAITKHGFSHKWTTKELETGSLEVRIHISGWGHTYSGTATVIPPAEENSLISQAQKASIRNGFGKRITLAEGYGMVTEGEDNDGQMDDEQVMVYAEYIKRIHTAPTIEELQKRFLDATRELTGDRKGREMVIMAKDKRKKELTQ